MSPPLEAFLTSFLKYYSFLHSQIPWPFVHSFVHSLTHSFNVYWNIYWTFTMAYHFLGTGDISINNSLYNPMLELFVDLSPCGLFLEGVKLCKSFRIAQNLACTLSSVNVFSRNKWIVIKNGDDSNDNVSHSDESGVWLWQYRPGARYIVTVKPQARRLLGRWQVPSACRPSRCCHCDYFCY